MYFRRQTYKQQNWTICAKIFFSIKYVLNSNTSEKMSKPQKIVDLCAKKKKLDWTSQMHCRSKTKKGSYLPRSVQPDHPQVDLLGVRKKLSSYKDATPARLRAREGQQFRGSRCSASLQGWKDWSQGWQRVPSLWSRYVPPRPSCPPEKKIYSNKCLPFFCTFCCRLLFHYLHFH